MKKKIIASLLATMAVGATCAFAANPFADVPADHWAYKSVAQLAQAGIVQGYDGTNYIGDRTMTRYEMAEIVAKAMAHQDKADAEQRAMINKLADEFSDELNNLGVRVSNLEKKVGNIKTTGDFRLRYRHQSDAYKFGGDKDNTRDNQFQYRARVRFNATVNDSTNVVYGISANNQSYDNQSSASGDDGAHMYTDLAYVSHNFGSNFNVMTGRYTYIMGGGFGTQYGDAFDGIQAKYTNSNWSLTGGYGEFKEGAGYAGNFANGSTQYTSKTDDEGYTYKEATGKKIHTLVGAKTGYVALDGTFNKVGAGVYYNTFSDNVAAKQNLDNLWGGYLKFKLGNDWSLMGNYEKLSKDHATAADDDASMWQAQLKYGNASYAKKGSWDAWLEYVNADSNYLYGSTNTWRNNNLLDNVKSWGVGVDYTVNKNVMFSVMQSFSSSVKDNLVNGAKATDPEEETRAQFVFVF
jgi:hypothetical protein